jgi:hypothetical protein
MCRLVYVENAVASIFSDDLTKNTSTESKLQWSQPLLYWSVFKWLRTFSHELIASLKM